MSPFVPIDDSLDVTTSTVPARVSAAPRPSILPESTNARRRRSGLELQLPSLRALGIVFVALAAGTFLWRNGPRTLEEAPGDRAAVVTASAVAGFAGFETNPAHESFEVRRRLFGGQTLDYAYEPPGEPSARSPRIATTAKTHADEDDAHDEYRLQAVRLVMDWKLGGDVGLVPLDEGAPWADESAVYRVDREGETLGYALVLREGARTLYARLEGVELATSDVRALAEDALASLSARAAE